MPIIGVDGHDGVNAQFLESGEHLLRLIQVRDVVTGPIDEEDGCLAVFDMFHGRYFPGPIVVLEGHESHITFEPQGVAARPPGCDEVAQPGNGNRGLETIGVSHHPVDHKPAVTDP